MFSSIVSPPQICDLIKSFSNPVSEKIQFKIRMKPMFSAFLFCEFTAKIICKSFYIIVFTQGIIFSSQNKCFMVPYINRMTFNICIIWKIQRFYIILYLYSFLELFFCDVTVFHKIMNDSFHICYRREKPCIFYIHIRKCKQFKISSHTTPKY